MTQLGANLGNHTCTSLTGVAIVFVSDKEPILHCNTAVCTKGLFVVHGPCIVNTTSKENAVITRTTLMLK